MTDQPLTDEQLARAKEAARVLERACEWDSPCSGFADNGFAKVLYNPLAAGELIGIAKTRRGNLYAEKERAAEAILREWHSASLLATIDQQAEMIRRLVNQVHDLKDQLGESCEDGCCECEEDDDE